MQHFSDCDGSAMFGISPVAIWTNSYQHPTQFDLFQTSSKLSLTWVGVQILQSLGCSQKLLIPLLLLYFARM
jgi:hypothetical protein